MSILSFKTRNGISVRGIPKVYFCCHPEDFKIYFESISNEILAKQNCSIWYHGDKSVDYTDEFYDDLGQMQLFVIPVTSRFLQNSNAVLEKEFLFAVEHHIPILPLMQESGLDKRFNSVCGNIQYLDKYNTDSTCIEYDDKLGKFLSSVLVGDELAEKIRSAFDAYVFLSYRKKDRRYAQELMRLIHKNEFCRDIAIWYDEFLVPGEDFNSAIRDALQRSDLFVLTVTPNLVNEDNYIMKVEYPMARQENKPVLPCEMAETDRDALSQKYSGIPECRDGRDGIALSEGLMEHFRSIAIRENDSDPEHLFFIGLAYLNGIDVEVDRKRALELITCAAEKGLSEAVEKLVSMYSTGDGVRRDIGTALEWRKKLLEITQAEYGNTHDFNTAYAYIRAEFELANACYEMNLYEEAKEYANALNTSCSIIPLVTECSALESLELRHHTALASLLLGQIYHAENDFDKAKEEYDIAERMFLYIIEECDSPYILRDTSILYNKIAQLCKVRAEYERSLEYYNKALNIQRLNKQYQGDALFIMDEVVSLFRMSEILRLRGDNKASTENLLAALEILDSLISLHGIKDFLGLKMMCLLSLADSYRVETDFEKALNIFEELSSLEDVYRKQTGETAYYFCAMRLAKTAQICFQKADWESAIEYGEKALEIINTGNVISDEEIATGSSIHPILYTFVGYAYYTSRRDIEGCLRYIKQGVVLADDYLQRGVICNVPDFILIYSTYSDILQITEDTEESGKYLRKALELYETQTPDFENIRDIATACTLYMAVGKDHLLKGMAKEALEYMQKAESLYNKMFSISPGSEEILRRDTAQLYNLIAACFVETDDPRAIDYYEKCAGVYEHIPEEKYAVDDWNTLGVVYYQLYVTSKGLLKPRKWKKLLFNAAYTIKEQYPELYTQTAFYELLNETGLFD